MSARVRQQSTMPAQTPARSGAGGGLGLPPYEAPSFPRNTAAQRALAQLQQKHSLAKLDWHLDEALAAVSGAAGEINDRLTDKEKANKKRKDREEENEAENVAVDDTERSLEEMRDKVDRMTQRMEDGMRKLIDGQHSVQSVKDSIDTTVQHARVNASTQASTQARTQTQRRRTRGEGEADEDDEDDYRDFEPTDPAAGTQAQASSKEKFNKDVETAKTRYQGHTLAARYAENPHYRDFRRVVHDARNHDGESVLPHHSEWFPEGERPAPGVTTRRAREDAEDADSDDDIAVSKATISTKCPLTLQEFKNPLTSTKCPHSFEGEAILQMIAESRPQQVGGPRAEKAVQCPVSACSKILTKADLHTDNVLIRKIKRIQEAARMEEEDDDDDEGGPAGTSRGATFIDDDEDGADVDDIVEGRVKATQVKGEPRGTGRSRPSQQQQPPRASGVVNLAEESSDDEAEEGDDEEMED